MTTAATEIPLGLCQCGCGRETAISTVNHARVGWVKGQPKRYYRGHSRRSRPVDYLVDPQTGCWVWQKFITAEGYGFQGGPGPNAAHKWMYERHRGPVPDGLQLDHLCRNRACVNPAHLEPVTPAENAQRSNVAKLNWDSVREIRENAEGLTNPQLAARFGVSRSTIKSVKAGTSWRT